MPTEHFWSKIDATGDCWLYTEFRDRQGYGKYWDGLRKFKWYAHRFAWTDLIGPIPEGVALDHLCKNKPCVNPIHLEPVTQGDNARRGFKSRINHCPHGHPYDYENTRHTKKRPGRYCKECNRLKQARRRAERNECN